ncbi:MAG TPA: hypothetical protein VFA32_14080 [Dehalococcoidia bacterium]|nr:hypothetical protein [Dehalococcoidia bacterium]
MLHDPHAYQDAGTYPFLFSQGAQHAKGPWEDIDEVVAELYALAAAIYNRLPVPPILQVRVQPYIDTFRAQQNQQRDDGAQEHEEQRSQLK